MSDPSQPLLRQSSKTRLWMVRHYGPVAVRVYVFDHPLEDAMSDRLKTPQEWLEWGEDLIATHGRQQVAETLADMGEALWRYHDGLKEIREADPYAPMAGVVAYQTATRALWPDSFEGGASETDGSIPVGSDRVVLVDQARPAGSDVPAGQPLRDVAGRLALTVRSYDAAPEADKPTYRAEVIQQARELADFLEAH